jgi:hypothetical protein
MTMKPLIKIIIIVIVVTLTITMMHKFGGAARPCGARAHEKGKQRCHGSCITSIYAYSEGVSMKLGRLSDLKGPTDSSNFQESR